MEAINLWSSIYTDLPYIMIFSTLLFITYGLWEFQKYLHFYLYANVLFFSIRFLSVFWCTGNPWRLSELQNQIGPFWLHYNTMIFYLNL